MCTEKKKLQKHLASLNQRLSSLDERLGDLDSDDATGAQELKWEKVDLKAKISDIEAKLQEDAEVFSSVAQSRDTGFVRPVPRSVQAETADSEQAPFSCLVAC